MGYLKQKLLLKSTHEVRFKYCLPTHKHTDSTA